MSAGPRVLPERVLEPGTLLIADLHLDLAGDEPPRAFLGWLEAQEAVPEILVLGDFFDFWIGPAQAELPAAREVLRALRALALRGTRLSVVPGNRDFLLDARFECASGAAVYPHGLLALLPDAAGEPQRAALVHGDELCTLDRAYLRLRRVLRSGAVRGLARALPVGCALWLARRLRRASTRALSVKPEPEKAMQEAACRRLAEAQRASWVVCGHAHDYRDLCLEGGPRWIVLDAFGGRHDILRVARQGGFELAHGPLEGARGVPQAESGARRP